LDRDRILAILIEKVRQVVPELNQVPCGPEDSLNALGLDSVERHEVVILTLEALNLDIPLVQTYGPRNIGELAALLYGKQAH
jgi:polyketide biosynthesis acyl carrier protein